MKGSQKQVAQTIPVQTEVSSPGPRSSPFPLLAKFRRPTPAVVFPKKKKGRKQQTKTARKQTFTVPSDRSTWINARLAALGFLGSRGQDAAGLGIRGGRGHGRETWPAGQRHEALEKPNWGISPEPFADKCICLHISPCRFSRESMTTGKTGCFPGGERANGRIPKRQVDPTGNRKNSQGSAT